MEQKFVLGLFITFCLFQFSIATLGIDLATPVQDFSCLKKSYEFVITRAYRSLGIVDQNAPLNIINARKAGFQYVDVYLFPCRGKSAQTQVDEMVSFLDDQLEKLSYMTSEKESSQYQQRRLVSDYGTTWIDVETNPSPNCGWGTNYEENCQFLEEIVEALKSHSKATGIYASHYMWKQIFGDAEACQRFKDLPLWFARYDNIPSFVNFQSFGGWEKPSIKQYNGTAQVCGIGVDLNYY